MTIFASKDWSVAKSDKIRTIVGRKMGKGSAATDAEVGQFLDRAIVDLVKSYDQIDAASTVQEI